MQGLVGPVYGFCFIGFCVSLSLTSHLKSDFKSNPERIKMIRFSSLAVHLLSR